MMASSSVPGRNQWKPVRLLAQEPQDSGLVQGVPLKPSSVPYATWFSTALGTRSMYMCASTQPGAQQYHTTGEKSLTKDFFVAKTWISSCVQVSASSSRSIPFSSLAGQGGNANGLTSPLTNHRTKHSQYLEEKKEGLTVEGGQLTKSLHSLP